MDGIGCYVFEKSMVEQTLWWMEQTKNTLLMGHLVSYKNDTDQIKRNFPNHINGVACYAKNIIEYIPENTFYT